MDIVHACLDIIEHTNPEFWALENPVGRMGRLMTHRLADLGQPKDGSPVFSFDPCDYAGWADEPAKEAYTKKTLLWGNFWPLQKKPVEVNKTGRYTTPIWKYGGKSERTKRLRSITPSGFAKAFFEANK